MLIVDVDTAALDALLVVTLTGLPVEDGSEKKRAQSSQRAARLRNSSQL